MNRRTFLGGAAVASLPVTAVAMPKTEEPKGKSKEDLAEMLAETMKYTYGGNWRVRFDPEDEFVFIVKDFKKT